MAGDRSDRTAPKATADQPPTEGEPAYEPRDDRLAPEHEEPLDGPEPEARAAASEDRPGGDGGRSTGVQVDAGERPSPEPDVHSTLD